jgi:hypothetical protein
LRGKNRRWEGEKVRRWELGSRKWECGSGKDRDEDDEGGSGNESNWERGRRKVEKLKVRRWEVRLKNLMGN